MVYGLLLGERILVFKSYCKCIFFVSKMVVLVKGMRGVVKNGRLLARMDVQCVCCVLKNNILLNLCEMYFLMPD
jgi:hypothetical protein